MMAHRFMMTDVVKLCPGLLYFRRTLRSVDLMCTTYRVIFGLPYPECLRKKIWVHTIVPVVVSYSTFHPSFAKNNFVYINRERDIETAIANFRLEEEEPTSVE